MIENSRSSRGIAIVSVLVIMVAVLILGAGAMFLTQINLNIASNVRSNSVAENNAAAGLSVAFHQLEVAFRSAHASDPETAQFPASLTLGSVSGPSFTPSYNLVSYERNSTDTSVARVSVRGTGPSNAEHVTEALVRMFPGEPQLPPGFAFGLASEGVINVNGNSSYISAGIHGNLGFNLTGNVDDDFFICVRRDSSGVCIETESIPLADAPVSASPGATACSPADLCDGGVPRTLVSPIAVEPDFEARRRIAIADASSGSESGTSEVTFDGVTIDCDVVIPGTPTAATLAGLLPASGDRDGKTVCLTSSGTVTFPANFETQGLNIVSNGSVHFARSGGNQADVRDSIVVTMGGSISSDNARLTIHASRLFSEGSMDFNGQQTQITGVTTLASNGDIVVNGGAPAVTSTDGPAVGFSIIASGNVTINGSADWYVAASVGGTFTQNGTATVYGAIEAKDTITINGGIDIDSGLPIVTNDLEEEGPPRIGVVSQR